MDTLFVFAKQAVIPAEMSEGTYECVLMARLTESHLTQLTQEIP